MEKTQESYFSPSEQHLSMEAYEEVKHIICKKGNKALKQMSVNIKITILLTKKDIKRKKNLK